MSILITTIGQRDLQVVQKNSCQPIERRDLMEFQKRISEAEISVKWQPYMKKKRLNQLENSFFSVKDLDMQPDKNLVHKVFRKSQRPSQNKISLNITFPLIEKVLKKTNNDIIKNIWTPLGKIYIYYTDRHEAYANSADKKLKGRLKQEPWYFAHLIKQFYPQLKQYYNLTNFPSEIMVIKVQTKSNDINRNDIIAFMDTNIYEKNKEIDTNNPAEKLVIACSGGLPDVKNVIEEVCSLYFPDNSYFYDQDQQNDNIRRSIYHEYKKKAKERYELINRIQNWDFAAAYSICSKPTSLVHKKSDIYALVRLAHEWLSGDPVMAEKLCDDLTSKDSEHRNLYKTMKKMLSKDKNSSTRSLIRLMHLYRTRNYWGAATVLITAVENLCAKFICNAIPQCCVKKNGRLLFKKNKIQEISKEFQPHPRILYSSDTNLIIDNFIAYESIITFLCNNNNAKKETAKIIKDNFLKGSAFSEFKNKRNEFIHNGDSLKKDKLDEILFNKENKKISYSDEFLGSPLLKQIAAISDEINLDFVNWLPIISQKLISKIDSS
jgi:hypothetical protein